MRVLRDDCDAAEVGDEDNDDDMRPQGLAKNWANG